MVVVPYIRSPDRCDGISFLRDIGRITGLGETIYDHCIFLYTQGPDTSLNDLFHLRDRFNESMGFNLDRLFQNERVCDMPRQDPSNREQYDQSQKRRRLLDTIVSTRFHDKERKVTFPKYTTDSREIRDYALKLIGYALEKEIAEVRSSMEGWMDHFVDGMLTLPKKAIAAVINIIMPFWNNYETNAPNTADTVSNRMREGFEARLFQNTSIYQRTLNDLKNTFRENYEDCLSAVLERTTKSHMEWLSQTGRMFKVRGMLVATAGLTLLSGAAGAAVATITVPEITLSAAATAAAYPAVVTAGSGAMAMLRELGFNLWRYLNFIGNTRTPLRAGIPEGDPQEMLSIIDREENGLITNIETSRRIVDEHQEIDSSERGNIIQRLDQMHQQLLQYRNQRTQTNNR